MISNVLAESHYEGNGYESMIYDKLDGAGITLVASIWCFFFFKQKTAYEILAWLEFRRVLFRSCLSQEYRRQRWSTGPIKGVLSCKNKKYICINRYINSHLPEALSVCCCAALILLTISSAIVVSSWLCQEQVLPVWMSGYKWMSKQTGPTHQILQKFKPSLFSTQHFLNFVFKV